MTRQLHPLARLTRSIGLRILFSTALTLAVPHLVWAQQRDYAYVAYGTADAWGSNGGIAVVNTVAKSIVRTIPLGFQPNGITAQPPDGRFLYVTGAPRQSGTDIVVVDTL